jgi:hypothetical protein
MTAGGREARANFNSLYYLNKSFYQLDLEQVLREFIKISTLVRAKRLCVFFSCLFFVKRELVREYERGGWVGIKI